MALYSAILLNPTVAIPIHRSVNRAIRAAREAHDAYPLLAKILTDSGLAASAVTDIMARDLPTLDKLEDSATYLVNTFGKLNITTGVVERAQRLYEEAATFKREAYVKAGIVSRRLLSTPSLLHAATCPVVSVFIADFQDPANLLVKHLQYNVPRSVCRLMYPQGGEVWNTKCGPPSWQVGINTTPPLPPTPQLPKPPPPPFETGVVFKTGALQTYAFSWFYQATGFNVTSYFLVKAAEILGALPGPAHKGAPSEGLVLLDKKLQCAYDSSVQCLNKDTSLLYKVGYVALEITLLVTVLKVLRVGWASTLVMSLGIFFFLPRVMSRTYNLQYGCSVSFYPVIPVCLVSDMQDIVYQLLPSQLPWPKTLVNATLGATITKANVFDCTSIGFGGGFQELAYLVEYITPKWHTAVLGYTLPTFFNQTLVHTPQYEACALLYSFNALPLVLLFGVALVFAAAALHVGFMVSSYLFSVFGDVFRLVVGLYIAIKQPYPRLAVHQLGVTHDDDGPLAITLPHRKEPLLRSR